MRMITYVCSVILMTIILLAGCAVDEPETLEQELAESQHSQIVLYPNVLRIVNGDSLLERNRYFNLCSTGSSVYSENIFNELDYLLDQVNITFGRRLGHMHYRRDLVEEDPSRPGYADVATIYSAFASNRVEDEAFLVTRFGDNLDVIMHGRSLEFPDFFEQEAADTPANLDAAAEYLVEGLKARFTDFTRPKYYELVNEPKWPVYMSEQFHRLHAVTAQRVRQEGLDVLVGGPCLSVAYFYRENYTQGFWNGGIRGFIDNAGADVDFISFHVYDFFHGLRPGRTVDVITGLPLEQVFDVIAAYATAQIGTVLPVAISEHGATGHDFWIQEDRGDPALGAEVSRSELLWRHANSLNGQVMTFMNHPVLKAVPFTLYTANFNPRYVRVLYQPQDFDPANPYERTDAIMFYQLWRDVQGYRLRVHSDDPDLQSQAFLHNDQVFLAVNNLASVEKQLDLDVVGSSAPATVSISRFYFEQGRSQLDEDQPWLDFPQLTLRPQETVIIRFDYDQEPAVTDAVQEMSYFSDQITTPVDSESQLHTISVPDGEPIQYGYLRIGITRPHDLAWDPDVTFNGQALQVPAAASDTIQLTSPEYATTKIIPVPAALLSDENRVTIRFPDRGGVIASVALVVGRSYDPQAYYMSKRLPSAFAAIQPQDGATGINPLQLTFAWEEASGADFYQLLVATDSNLEDMVVNMVTQDVQSVVDTLHYGSDYYWTVRAGTKAEIGNFGLQRFNQEQVQSFSTAAPSSVPPSVTPRLTDGLGTVTIRWSGVVDADGYRIYRGDEETGELSVIAADLPRTTVQYEDYVTQGQSYSYSVVAFNSLGDSEVGAGESILVRPIVPLIETDFSSDLDPRWQQAGAWSRDQATATANLRAMFPRVFGSLEAQEIVGDSYVFSAALRLNEIANPELAVLRMAASIVDRDRYQLIYWNRSGTWELSRRRGSGSETLAKQVYPLTEEVWYQLDWQVQNGVIELLINGDPILSTRDPEPIVAGGGVELYLTNLDVDFDFVRIRGH